MRIRLEELPKGSSKGNVVRVLMRRFCVEVWEVDLDRAADALGLSADDPSIDSRLAGLLEGATLAPAGIRNLGLGSDPSWEAIGRVPVASTVDEEEKEGGA